MGTKIKCKLCNSIIEGDGKGTLVSCSCNSCFIDETKYYSRIGGNPSDIVSIDENGNELPFINEPEVQVDDRVDKINYYLDIAEIVSERSTCLDSHYGAIIVNNDELISSGYNGSPRKLLSCCEKGKCVREGSTRGTGYDKCTSVHAEQNAIISAARSEMIGSTLYLVGTKVKTGNYVVDAESCILCKRMIINAGIKSVIIRLNKDKYKIQNVSDWSTDDIINK